MTLTHLGRELALPDTLPFTTATARAAGLDHRRLGELIDAGVLKRLLRGVYAAAALPDSQLLRARALGLAVPQGFVVTDESAGWLAGAPMILRPDPHPGVPPLTIFATGDHDRLRNGLCDSGRRRLREEDVVEVEGVVATTPLRTLLDLGRLRHRDRAIAAMDQLLAVGSFDVEEVHRELPRFRGMRGVVQLRTLLPLADPRAESPPESALRLRFRDAGLPSPTPQLEIHDEDGRFLGRADLAIEELRFVAEYDGVEFHGPDRASHDERRRAAMEEAGWTVRVVRKENLYGHHQDVIPLLLEGVAAARRRCGDRRTS